jgi:hypothetical protein
MYRSQLERKRSQRIDAEKKVGAFRKKEADKRLAAAKAKEAAARARSTSTVKMKLDEATRRESEANTAAKDAATWQTKVATLSKEESDLALRLSKADKSEQANAEQRHRRQEAAAEAKLRARLQATEQDLAIQRARSDAAERELAAQRARTAATEERVDGALQELRAPKPEVLRVLLIGASGDGELRVAREQSRIRAAVERALHRQLIAIDPRPAATIADLMDGVVRFRPHVIHFAGHGDE